MIKTRTGQLISKLIIFIMCFGMFMSFYTTAYASEIQKENATLKVAF